jgi:hypothetical protein
MYDCLRSESESASHSSPPQLKGVRVISACVRACVLTAVVHAHKSGPTKNRYGHAHQCSIHTTVYSPKEKEKDKRMHAHALVHACAHRSSTTSQGCASVHYMCKCVCCFYFASPSTMSVCLSVCTCTSVCPDACIYNTEVLCMCNKHLMLGQTAVIYTHTYTHSHTFNTFTQAQYSVNSHEEKSYSLE